MGGWWMQIADAIADGRVELASSPDLLAEFATTSQRPRICNRIPPVDAELFGQLLAEQTTFYEPGESARVCRDPRDDYLLALAVAARADYLVTRDEDLLVLGRYFGTEIIYPARFLALLDAAI